MTELLGLDDLMAELIVAVGAAMVLGSGLAIIQHARGKRPEGADGEFRAGRVSWLLTVGMVITVWGLASLLST
jgi:hypothetical protein